MKIANAFSLMLLSLTCLITGCATPFYGYTEDEWEQLSAEEKRAAHLNIKISSNINTDASTKTNLKYANKKLLIVEQVCDCHCD